MPIRTGALPILNPAKEKGTLKERGGMKENNLLPHHPKFLELKSGCYWREREDEQ